MAKAIEMTNTEEKLRPSKFMDIMEKMSLDELRNYALSVSEDLDYLKLIKLPKLLDKKDEQLVSLEKSLNEKEREIEELVYILKDIQRLCHDMQLEHVPKMRADIIGNKAWEILAKYSAKETK